MICVNPITSKNLKHICESNTEVAIQLRVDKTKMVAEHEDELFRQEVRHRQEIKDLRKKHSLQTESLKQSIKDTTRELSEVTDMSMHVAEECFQLKNSSDAEVHQSTKQAERSDALSKARLEKLKKSKEKEVKLRETLDSTTEAFEVQLAKAHAEIGVLTELLADSNCEVNELQEALVKAREELAVSDAFLIS